MLVFFRLVGGPPAEARPLQKLLQSQAEADAMRFDGVPSRTIVIFEKPCGHVWRRAGVGRRER